ncbi:response regulator [Stappia stellulata]|uniref:response regulator n=1 Tax=Stappia TaxID=152161 RepID=UPI001CD6EB71|nr:response regulator [Stappia stellulata]MCA1243660.1 response regulator [Stappia stellulata]
MRFTSNSGSGRRNAVMLVERSAFTRRLIKSLLKELGIDDVIEAANATAAEQMLKTHPVDAILLDWSQPELENARMLARLRRADNPKTAMTPVIITSTRVDLELLERAANLNASSVLVKPFSQTVLRSHLLAALGDLDAPVAEKPPQDAAQDDTPASPDPTPQPDPRQVPPEDSEIFYL